MVIGDTKGKPVALTIAGFDPSGGAGVVADIKTFTAFECYAVAAITSLTFQNTSGVFGAVHHTAETVRAQILPVLEEYEVSASKTGMLPTKEVIAEVAGLYRETNLDGPVVDPVVCSTSGYDLIDEDALAALVRELIPLARVVTPNIPEAERITRCRIEDEEGMRRAARAIRDLGATAVLVKGGHLRPNEGGRTPVATDVLDDRGKVTIFRGDWIETSSTHGTGCTLSAAIAACLAHGLGLEEAVGSAKEFVTNALRDQVPGAR